MRRSNTSVVSKVTTPPATALTIAIIISFVIFALRLLKYQKIISFSVSLISLTKKDNYDFIRYFFSDEEIKNYFKDTNKTIFYDFDGLKTNQEKFITIFELYGLCIAQETSLYIEELLKNYTHEADVIIDIFTHDDHLYRISNLEGIVKVEEVKRA